MGPWPASNRHFMVISELGDHVLYSAGSHYIMLFTSQKESEFCAGLPCFLPEFLKVTIAGPSSIHRLALKTTYKFCFQEHSRTLPSIQEHSGVLKKIKNSRTIMNIWGSEWTLSPNSGTRERYLTNLMAMLIELSSTCLWHVQCHLSRGVKSLWPLERAASQDRLAPTNRLLQASTDTVTVEGRLCKHQNFR